MALQYLFDPNKQFQSLGGVNEVSGFLRVFLNGTDDRATTYRNFDGGMNEPDIVLDSYGRAVVIVDDTKTYRLEVYNRLGGLMWTISNYKARGGSGGGSGTTVSVEGTADEIDVTENSEDGIIHFIVSLSKVFKNTIDTIQSSMSYIASAVNGKKDKQTESSYVGSATQTLVGVTQDENGEINAVFEDIDFPDYSQRFENIENEQAVDAKVIATSLNDLNARLAAIESEGDNIGDVKADSLDAQNLYVGGVKVKFQQAAMSLDGATNKTVTNISQDENGVITVTYSAIAFPDWTSAITAATDLCEKLANKKTTFTGNTSSDTFYPTIKAVVDYLDARLQNLGGKLITDNGDPFASESVLPSTTPFQGQNILTNDYAYVQDSGLAARYTFTVDGSSVTWTKEYEISFPVFTTAQQNAIDSGITSVKVSGYDSHVANDDIHVTATQKDEWSGKQDALSTVQMDAVNSGINFDKVSDYDSHVADTDIHVTASEKTTWNAKQDAIADLSDIRDGASKGETAVQPGDLATYMTNPVEGGVIAAALNDLNARLNALEYEDENIGDKIADKFDAQVLRCGGVDVKTKQAAKTSPSASGTSIAFIDSVSQNENGEITATKKAIQSASVSHPGIVQLNSTVVSTSTTQAATPSAVKAAYDLANGKQNPIGINSSSGNESLFLTQKGSWLPTPNEIVIIDNTYDVDSVLSLISAGKTPVYKYGANYLYNLEKYQESGTNRFATFTQSRLDSIYAFGPSGLQTIKVTYIYQSTVTTSGWSNDSYYTYGNESLVSSIASPYIDNLHFPTTKAVSDFVDQAISGVGGKQITDNGSPFTSSASLPSSTPYGGQNIVSNDYAYVQQGYTVTRYEASVSGSSVTWSESFSIDTSAFLTVPIDFTEAQTVKNINANETLPTILGKIKKWFTDKISQLGNLAFLNQVRNAQISGTINDNHISSANTWNAKADKAPSSGNGNLAVIDTSGNYVSSGITAYSQTQYNNQTERLAAWLSSFTSMSHAFNVVFSGTQISKTISFENEFTGVKYLRLGIAYFSGEIQYYLPFSGNSSEYNGWIIKPDTSQKYGLSTMHSTHNFVVQGTSNNEELFGETELGTTGQSVEIIFEKAINTSRTVRGRISSELRLINIPSNDMLFVHIDLAYERLSSNGNFYAFGTVFVNTEATEL